MVNVLTLDNNVITKYFNENRIEEKYVDIGYHGLFYSLPGQEHYYLLNYLGSRPYIKTITEFGTARGSSSAAFGVNHPDLKIITWDIFDSIPKEVEKLPNVTYKNTLGKYRYLINDEQINDALKADMIFLDTAHDGIFETVLYRKLCEKDYKGWLLIDDIYLNGNMNEFWNSISQMKFDISKYGHWSGTGIVTFNNDLTIVYN